MEKVINWKDGNGAITVSFNGNGDGTITVTSTPNTGESRSQEITIETTYPVAVKKILIVYQDGSNIKIVDGGNAFTTDFDNTIDCETADSVFVDGEDALYDGGGASED